MQWFDEHEPSNPFYNGKRQRLMMQLGSTSSSSQARSSHPSVLEHGGVGDGQEQAEAVLLWLEARI